MTQTEPASDSSGPTAGEGVRYELLENVGEGGVGTVFRARDRELGRFVALKFLHEGYAERPQLKKRFIEEAQIGAQLQPPGVVPVYDMGELDGRAFFSMKFVKGDTLRDALAARKSSAEDLHRLLVLFEDVCQTIAYAHARRVLHRDLKPDNIMIGPFGEVQVADWGMGKVLDEESVPEPDGTDRPLSVIETERSSEHGHATKVGAVFGTPQYMAPEQALGLVGEITTRTDVFALGAILCEILTGRPPYDAGGSSKQFRQDANPEDGGGCGPRRCAFQVGRVWV